MNETVSVLIFPSAAVEVGAALIELGRDRSDPSTSFSLPSVN